MEFEDMEKLFFDNNSIKLNNEANLIKSFIKELIKYNRHLTYDYSVLNLYAKYVGVLN